MRIQYILRKCETLNIVIEYIYIFNIYIFMLKYIYFFPMLRTYPNKNNNDKPGQKNNKI